jgi:hypothetical protein
MPKFLIKGSYTTEGLKGVLKEGAPAAGTPSGSWRITSAGPNPSTSPSGTPTSTQSSTCRT